MKKYLVILLSFAGIYVSCTIQKPVTYQFPAEMSQAIKTDYTNQCEKGRILYSINCAGCHTIRKGRKELLPGFTEAQLQGYHIRGGNTSHETSVSEERVNAEELVYIVTFLTYRTQTPDNTYTPKINEHEHQQ
jgi:hypothetical protein